MADEYKVSPATIRRDGKAAALIDEHPDKAREVIQGNVKLADAVREIRRAEIKQTLDSTATRKAKAIEGVYDVLVIDPPWPLVKIERDERPMRATGCAWRAWGRREWGCRMALAGRQRASGRQGTCRRPGVPRRCKACWGAFPGNAGVRGLSQGPRAPSKPTRTPRTPLSASEAPGGCPLSCMSSRRVLRACETPRGVRGRLLRVAFAPWPAAGGKTPLAIPKGVDGPHSGCILYLEY